MHLSVTPPRRRSRVRPAENRRIVGLWLLALAGMVFVMAVLGGLTRLSGSGLSMVEWQPFNPLPPLTAADWQAMFAKYQASPQYQLVNSGMTLAGFKGIFWLEFIHRLWGRLIGVAFLVPFLIFVWQGRLGRADVPRLVVLFVVGALQGALGWFMVSSGLSSRPEVSHYRLAAHLLAALAIYGVLLWSALSMLQEPSAAQASPSAAAVRRGLLALLALVCLTVSLGGLVAGLHAGMVYNDFPWMNGRVLPAEAFDLTPVWRNAVDNPVLVQFEHRLLAIATWSWALVVGLAGWRLAVTDEARAALSLLPLAATLQAGLGIATLMLAVPLPLAAAHQAGAFVLFTATVWAIRIVSRTATQ
jgi:cytochrome c oxidase assembly protein subunit 15